MPNHVYHHIIFNTTLSSKQKEILKEIGQNNRGICGYYLPMPDDLIYTSSPAKIVSQEEYDETMKRIDTEKPTYATKPITIAMSELLKSNHGYDNWYDWACDDRNWGTKWGCYDTEVEEDVIRCTTAWGPFSDKIFNMFIKDFPDVEWQWEEEQGYGATVIVEDGEVIASDDYDPIQWVSVGGLQINEDDPFETSICYTRGRHSTIATEFVPPGFYMDYSEHEPIGETLPIDMYNKLSKEEQEQVLKYYHSNKIV